MLRAAVTLVLDIAALSLTLTSRGAAVLGSARRLLVAALVLMGLLQVHRLATLWRARHRGDVRNQVPKRPLGLD